MTLTSTRREFMLGTATAALGCKSTPEDSALSPLVVGGLPVTCNLTLPVACAARLLSMKAGGVRGAGFEYSKYSGWPEIKESLMAVVLLLLASVVGAGCNSEGYRSGVFDPPREAPDFVLEGSHGSPITLGNYRGKVVALAFGFSHCPRICPVTLSRLAEVDKSLGALAKDFSVVFVTVDPERDTPGRLREFLEFFDADFRGATGEPSKLDALQHAYGVVANRVHSEDKKLGYEVHHSTSIYLIDKQGVLRLLVPFGEPAADILHDVKRLLDP